MAWVGVRPCSAQCADAIRTGISAPEALVTARYETRAENCVVFQASSDVSDAEANNQELG